VDGVAHVTRARADWLGRWLPVVLWAMVISLLSTDMFSGEHTSSLLLPILETVLPGASPETQMTVHAGIRKLAHVTEYAILAMLVLRALERPGRSVALLFLTTMAICASYAALDEFHQTFVPSRTASPVDAGIDTFGAALGFVTRRRARAAISAGRRSRA
jgi:VanZ family protein